MVVYLSCPNGQARAKTVQSSNKHDFYKLDLLPASLGPLGVWISRRGYHEDLVLLVAGLS